MKHNYRVVCSDAFIDVFADTAETALRITHDVDPVAELLYAQKLPDAQDWVAHYVVIDEQALGYVMGELPTIGVLRSHSPDIPENEGPIPSFGHKTRPATVADFLHYGFHPSGRRLIYSPNEAAVNDGAGFWNNYLGYVSLEDAQVFSPEDAEIQMANDNLPASTGHDVKFCSTEGFLSDPAVNA